MSEQVLLMVSTRCPLRTRQGTVVGSDVLPRRRYKLRLEVRHTSFEKLTDRDKLSCARLRPQSDRGEKHELGLFTYTRDHTQTLEKSDRRGSAFSVSGPRYGKCLTNYVLPLSIGVD